MSKSELKDILIAMEEKIVKLREVSGLICRQPDEKVHLVCIEGEGVSILIGRIVDDLEALQNNALKLIESEIPPESIEF